MATWWRWGKGHTASMRAHRQASPELGSVGRTKVYPVKPTGSPIMEWGEGYKMTMLRVLRGPQEGQGGLGLLLFTACLAPSSCPCPLYPWAFTVKLIWQPPMI